MPPVNPLMAGPGSLEPESVDPHVKSTYVNCDPDPGAQRRRRPLPPPAVPPLAESGRSGPVAPR